MKGGVGRRFIVDDDCQQFAGQHTNESAIDVQSFKDGSQWADDLGINNVANPLSVTGLKQSVKQIQECMQSLMFWVSEDGMMKAICLGFRSEVVIDIALKSVWTVDQVPW